MKEIQQILKTLDSLKPNEKAVMATVIEVKGSSYRLPGAKMLILENGESYGTVSGGCLEADVLERAKTVLDSGKSQVFIYDTTNDEDSVFSFSMGCRGVIRILLEPIDDNPSIDFLRNRFENGKGVAAAVIRSGESEKVYRRFFFDETGKTGDQAVDKQISKHAVKVLATGISCLEEYEFGEVFFEYIAPPVSIKIFGAGADAVPLAKIAKSLGWHVTVIDHRQALANRKRFVNPDEIVIARPESIPVSMLDKYSVAVLMTHNYSHDKKILKSLLESDISYIGLLGPKTRTENILSELREKDFEISDRQLKKLYGPVGLDIGADLPETIALSILAEIQAFLANRKGGFLKNRNGSIYGRD